MPTVKNSLTVFPVSVEKCLQTLTISIGLGEISQVKVKGSSKDVVFLWHRPHGVKPDKSSF